MSQPYYSNLLKGLIIVLLVSTFSPLYGQKRLPRNISRATSVEYAPSISADGSTMIFQTDLYQLGSRFNLYMTYKNPNGYWDNPKELRNINTQGTKNDLIGGPSVSYDGNTLFFFASFAGGQGAEDIYYATRDGDDFGDPINIGPAINTSGYEGFPSVSPDGSILYFTRAAEEQTVDGVYCYSIWASERDADGKWQEAYKLPAPINMGCEKNPRIMTDNEMLVFSSIRESSLGEAKFDLFYSRKNKNNEWGEVKPLANVNTFEDELFAAVSACGEEMYIIAPTAPKGANPVHDDFINLDIYEAELAAEDSPNPVAIIQGRLVDADTGKPLPGEISIVKNGNEDHTGVISSNRAGGKFTLILTRGNQYTVQYKADGHSPKEVEYDLSNLKGCENRKEDIRIDKWNGPYKLTVLNRRTGKPMAVSATIRDQRSNSKTSTDFKELDLGVYETRVRSNGQYSIALSDSAITDTTFNFRPVVKNFEREGFEDTVMVSPGPPRLEVKIINKETKAPVPNSVLLVMNAQKRKTLFRGLMKTEKVNVEIDYKNTFVVFGVAPNHFSSRQVLDMSKDKEGGTIEMTIELVELKPGAKLVVNNITFATNSAELTKDSFTEIDQVISVLKQNTHIKIEVAAHTDDVGTPEANLTLSDARAKSVLDYMTSKGIDLSRLISKGYGEADPAVPNDNAKNRALNRRVEFRIPKN